MITFYQFLGELIVWATLLPLSFISVLAIGLTIINLLTNVDPNAKEYHFFKM